MAAATEPTEATAKGPKPAHLLLDSVSRALAAGVDREKIQTLIDMCRMAQGVQQAPVWKMCASTLDEYTVAVKPQV